MGVITSSCSARGHITLVLLEKRYWAIMSPTRQNACKHGFFRYFRIAEDFMTPHPSLMLYYRHATGEPKSPIRVSKASVRIARKQSGDRYENVSGKDCEDDSFV